MKLWSLVLVAAAVTPASAGPKPIKAEFLCGTFVDKKIKEPLASGKHAKITDPIACAIHMSDPNEPSHMGNVHTVRYPAGAKKVVTTGKTDDFGAQSDDDKKDFEYVMQPGADTFQPCENFDIVGSISDDLGTYFTKTIKITQTCPKPKPIAATITCYYEAQDGTPMHWPGNGEKQKPRFSAPDHELDCKIVAKTVPKGVELTGSLKINGKGNTEPAHEEPPAGWTVVDGAFKASDGDFEECQNFTITGTLVDADGATRWTGTRKIIQTCDD